MRSPSGQLWAPLFSLPPPCQPQGTGQTEQGIKPTWGQLHEARPTPRSPAHLLCLSSHTWEGRGSWGKHCAQVSAHPARACPGAPSRPGHMGPSCSLERLCFPRGMEGAGAEVMTQGPKAWDLSPLLYTPGPGQHVDVSAELSGILSHLLRRGIVPRVHWLQWGPTGTHGWLQEQSHARGQEQQGETAARGGHLRNKQGDGGRTGPTHTAPQPGSPSLGSRSQSKGPLEPDHHPS